MRLALTLTLAGGCLAAAAPARAAGCIAAFHAGEHRLTISSCIADGDSDVTATISRNAAGAILFNGQPIAGATVTNTRATDAAGNRSTARRVTFRVLAH